MENFFVKLFNARELWAIQVMGAYGMKCRLVRTSPGGHDKAMHPGRVKICSCTYSSSNLVNKQTQV